MTWQGLHEGILTEFSEAGRLTTDLAFSVMSGFLTIKAELGKKYSATHRAKWGLCPKYRAKNRLRAEKRRRALGIPVRS